MKRNLLKTLGLLIPFTIVATTPALASAADGPRLRDKDREPKNVVAAKDHSRGQSSRELIGQDVKNALGEGLGQVKDLVIDARAGRIVYALVASGGLLGVGEKIRPVPFAAFRDTYRADGDLVLEIERSRWDSVPAIRESEIDSLLNESRAQAVFSHFGIDWKDEMKRGRGESSDRTPKLLRVSRLNNKDVINAGQQVGKIEEVVLNFETRRASVLIDPNDDYTGTDQKFIIDFAQLSPSLDEPQKLTTTLTRAEFARATPMQEDWWMMNTGYPFIWTAGSPGYPGTIVAADTALRESTRPSARERSRPSLTVVEDALRNDPKLGAEAGSLSLEERDGAIIITGVVRSRDVKQDIGERLADLAPGWTVDNQLAVRSAGE